MREKPAVLGTAFLEGLSVLVVEIAGARALAPFFGTSLKVWTAQITATLLFLALGYGLGGRLSRNSLRLPQVFLAAGAWLVLFPFLRAPVLGATAAALGVAGGSFAASCLLFGVPLLCLGAVSPLLIHRLDSLEAGAGSSAGAIFFTNTLGGLAGGWLTALVLIPHLPLRMGLAATGLALLALGLLWSLRLKKGGLSAGLAGGVGLMLVFLAPGPAHSLLISGMPSTLLESRQSGVGLIQVFGIGAQGRTLLIDGITQGGMSVATGTSVFEFTEYQNFLAHRYHAQASSALLLGLGSGLLAKQLHSRGIRVTAAELEPAIEKAARSWFGLPAEVKVVHEDARAFLNRSAEPFDLIFLDAFAGENAPWYLTTREAAALMKSRLRPGGRLIVNLVTRPQGASPGLARLEAALLTAFGEVKVFVEKPGNPGSLLVNAAMVAGEGLKASPKPFASVVVERIRPRLDALLLEERAGRPGEPSSDDFCDLDYVDAEMRGEWRKMVLESMGAEILGD